MSRLLNVHRFRKGRAEAVYLDHLELVPSRGWTCAEFVMDHPRNKPSEWSGYFPRSATTLQIPTSTPSAHDCHRIPAASCDPARRPTAASTSARKSTGK